MNAILVVVFSLTSGYNAQWELGGNISNGSKGPTVDLKLSHTMGNWKFSAGGSVGKGEKFGVQAGFSVKFKRSVQRVSNRNDIFPFNILLIKVRNQYWLLLLYLQSVCWVRFCQTIGVFIPVYINTLVKEQIM